MGYGVRINKKNINNLFKQLEQRLKHTYFSSIHYDRQPKGALIGATKGKIKNNLLPCIGDCDYIACYESGEGISFAIESGYHQANAIINDMEAETVSIPIRDAFCGEVKKLDKEPLVRQDL